jgi:RimJ/RimL family protein N-acetyltransferase
MLTVKCVEPEGEVEHEVWPFTFTRENTQKLYEKASKFPVLFNRPLTSTEDFLSYFITQNLSGDPEPLGLLWVIGDFRGMFYMNDIGDTEATVHYSFFDRRHKGREPLVREMLKIIFNHYGFVRLNAFVPAYAGIRVRIFAENCGFKMEGRKRKAAWWKGHWFDTYMYGILSEDVIDGSTN